MGIKYAVMIKIHPGLGTNLISLQNFFGHRQKRAVGTGASDCVLTSAGIVDDGFFGLSEINNTITIKIGAGGARQSIR